MRKASTFRSRLCLQSEQRLYSAVFQFVHSVPDIVRKACSEAHSLFRDRMIEFYVIGMQSLPLHQLSASAIEHVSRNDVAYM